MIVNLNGKEIDLSKAVPLRVKDWKALGRIGVRPNDLADFTWEAGAKFIFFVLNKADSTVTQEDIDNLLATDPIIAAVTRAAGGEKAKDPS